MISKEANILLLNGLEMIAAVLTLVIMFIIFFPVAYMMFYMAITKGATYIRPLFISMTVILIGKQLIELFR